MKDEKNIEKKAKQVKKRYLKKRLKDKISRCPENCEHNYLHEDEHGQTRLCLYGVENPEEWPGNICDTKSKAETCPFFQPKYDKQKIIDDYLEDLQDPTKVAHEFKDIAALQWVLEERAIDWNYPWYQRWLVSIELAMYWVLVRTGLFI